MDSIHLQSLIIVLIIIGVVVGIILGSAILYSNDIRKHPEKHKDDFKLRNSNGVEHE